MFPPCRESGRRCPNPPQRGTLRASCGAADCVAFFESMIAHFESSLGIDPDRVFATGLSNGGHLAYRFAPDPPGGLEGGFTNQTFSSTSRSLFQPSDVRTRS